MRFYINTRYNRIYQFHATNLLNIVNSDLIRKMLLTFFILAVSCSIPFAQTSPRSIIQDGGKQPGQWFDMVQTDQVRYLPGDTATFDLTFRKRVQEKKLYVRYRHLNQVLGEWTTVLISTNNYSWTWQTPVEDYKGYLVEIFLKNVDEVLDHINIAVDVSSSWSKFPRYGFIAKYHYMSPAEIAAVISNLKRYHINGLQFYDWHYKHHMPLKGTPENPANTWNDIANRTNYFSTVNGYIEEAHKCNMMTMAYNLLYGAWSDAHLDGVPTIWRLFKDTNHQQPWMLDLPSGWASDIYMMDTSNPYWRDYIFSQTEKVFRALPFDGWHVDQLGDWGNMWNYQGEQLSVNKTFEPFLNEAKSNLNVRLVMNAVNQYGQSDIAKSPVDFLYTEVWDPNKTYADLARIINDNLSFSDGILNTVLAAYLNYDLSGSPGTFNMPGVLFADAVIFAAGGAHLELGEHMLCHEYFPNNNLVMSEELKHRLIHYYDFLVAYENLLRDNVTTSNIKVNSLDSVIVKSWPQIGAVWAFVKQKENRQIVHLINFTNAKSLNWRDNEGTQTEPETLYSLQLMFNIEADQQVKAMWIASPDFYQGSPIKIQFAQEDKRVSFTVPGLKYWDMLVIEYEELNSSIKGSERRTPVRFFLGQNYPNPFNPTTAIPFTMQEAGVATIEVFNILGHQIYHRDMYCNSGPNKLVFDGRDLGSGVYLYYLCTNHYNQLRKMLLMK